MEHPMIRKKCPCCFREISNEEADILIRDHEIRLHSPILNDLISPREDEKYARFWENMGNSQNVLETNRIIITNEMIAEANEELEETGMVPIEKTFDEQSQGYVLTIREDSMIVVSNTMACPHCHNILPQNFFRYDMISIGLAGSVATGKTVFMASLMMNGFRILNKANMTVRNAHGNPLDPEKIKMERISQKLFKDQICPDPTNKSFQQPVYLEMNLKLEKENRTFLVTFYDVAGETIRNEAGSGKTIFARHVDGIIFFVDPSQMFLRQPIPLKTTVDEKKILSSMRLLSPAEQAAMQRDNKMRGSQPVWLDFGTSFEEEDENLNYERNPETILDSLRMGIGDSELGNKYIALTVAKCDQLSELEEFREIPASSLLFERPDLKNGWMDMDHHVVRQKILEHVFEEKVYHLQRNVGEYKGSALFCISALGCETRQEEYQQAMITRAVSPIRPIRVEEPFLWLLMKQMQERGWI
ncbi:MAG: hypothetical protein Q4B70_08885 [Lachnospiraceae bacterium]|nr:hypothetical protein [Lachnospiraceae bacterium]